jgi:23S rRNA (guanosine2251-2'-O)-methyltransferase
MPGVNICQCMRPDCRFRFPLYSAPAENLICPKCGGPTHICDFDQPGVQAPINPGTPPGPDIEVLFDNIRSAYNVGSMLRTADGVGVKFLHFCGITPTPDHKKVAKTALGAQFSTPWEQHWDGPQAVSNIRAQGSLVWGLEISQRSEPIHEAIIKSGNAPLLLVIGNEITGIDPDILSQCDRIVRIPMFGLKQSLNVSIAFSVAVYLIRYSCQSNFGC